jgi:hypothetical protein
MNDPLIYLTIALSCAVTLSVIAIVGLRGFTGWLTLKHAELNVHRQAADAPSPNMTNRIEIANLKERLRKLEAIASGVDL